jgi:anti-anti-sigma regulatory factor
MKARPTKPSARGTAAKKPAATGKRAAVARKAKVTAKPAQSEKPALSAKPAQSAKSARAAKPAKAVAAGKPSRTALGAECTIEHAPELQRQLSKVLADRACVTLDFSAVKRCDTAGMQVLAAFIRERREAGRDIELASMSESFLATVKLLGLSALFTPPAAVSA